VGRDNTYGHPTPTTLRELRGVGRVYRTDRDGTVRLRAQDGRLEVHLEGAS
jgi:competence protein ComEC